MSGTGSVGRNVEISDNRGTSVVFTGTATTTPANVPSTAGTIISGYAIQTGLASIKVSTDGGTTFWTVPRKSFDSHNIKGEVTQLVVKTDSGTSDYEILLHRELE